MSFIIAKLFGFIAEPGNVILLMFAAGAVLWFTRWRMTGVWTVAAGMIVYAALIILPIGTLLLLPLEERFSRPHPLPARVDGVIVLGGMIDARISKARGQAEVNDSADRLMALLELAHRYPQARLVFTGGSGLLFDPEQREADHAADLLSRAGLARERITFERDSRDTFENAAMSHALVRPQPGDTWILITSARHMPRSVGVFRAQGWPVVAWPVDYATEGGVTLRLTLTSGEGMRRVSLALHEWAGLLGYRLAGRSDTLFPGP